MNTPMNFGRRQAQAAEILRMLMDGPQTLADLAEAVTLSSAAINGWLNAYRYAGIVRICNRLPGKCYVYAFQAKPFAEPDAPLLDSKKAKARAKRVGTGVPA